MKSTALIQRKILPKFDATACAKAPRPLEAAYHQGFQHGFEEAIYLLANGLTFDEARRAFDLVQRQRFRKFDSALSSDVEDVGKEVA